MQENTRKPFNQANFFFINKTVEEADLNENIKLGDCYRNITLKLNRYNPKLISLRFSSNLFQKNVGLLYDAYYLHCERGGFGASREV